ncbi:PHB depolymerase family esterase [Methylobacterium sp. DB0501]|nr:PHB depolymerase family esterase [Methylobacterium sp. DB0501]
MAEVTRLTRAGRLAEAMALIQGRASAPEPASPSTPPSPRGSEPAIDLVAPTEPGGAWTAPTGQNSAGQGSSRQGSPSQALPGQGSPGQGSPGQGSPGQGFPAPGLADLPEAMRTLREAGSGLAGKLREGLQGLSQNLGQGLNQGLGEALGGGLPGGLPGAGLKPRRPVPVPEGARFEERRLSGAAGSLTYKVYVPRGPQGEGLPRTLPVVVMLHGCTQDPDDFALGTRMNDLAEKEGALVVYPRQERAANAQKCWNWFQPGDQGRGAGEPALIAGIARAVVEEFGADPTRVFVAGLSAGGAAAAILAATYPDVFAAAGIHSGLACGAARDLPSALAAMGQGGAAPPRTGATVPTIVFHGDGDRTVHPLNGERVAGQAMPGGGLTETVTRGTSPGGIPYTRGVHADATGRGIVETWVLHGVGHAWSGGSPDGSYTEPRGPDASAEMLRFFLAQARTEQPR